MSTANTLLAEATRGGITESFHHGRFAVCDATGNVIISAGEYSAPVFPRSAVKAFQCLPVVESGAADRFGLSEEEIALCCSSHNGEADHIRGVRSILSKCGVSEDVLECGAQWPGTEKACHDIVRAGERPRPVHNNCSGKHAGLICLAVHLGVDPAGYSAITHSVQRAVADAIGGICGINLRDCPHGIDGCSIPTWAFPLHNMAMGFGRLAAADHAAGQRIIAAARAHPFMIAGTGRFDTRIMEAVPRLFIKVGAEGVFCGAVPHAGLGFALKCDDGAGRAAEVAVAALLLKLNVWEQEERRKLEPFAQAPLINWMKTEVGVVRAAF